MMSIDVEREWSRVDGYDGRHSWFIRVLTRLVVGTWRARKLIRVLS
jgi:hypothetical protein